MKQEPMYLLIDKKHKKHENGEKLCVMGHTIKASCCELEFDSDKVELKLGEDFEIKVEDGKTYVVRRKFKYPKTLEECCKLLNDGYTILIKKDYELGYKGTLLHDFQKLHICRDAYRKIVSFSNKGSVDYVICNVGGNIIQTNIPNSAYNHILSFHTEESRDVFYENFKDLIEKCKELL